MFINLSRLRTIRVEAAVALVVAVAVVVVAAVVGEHVLETAETWRSMIPAAAEPVVRTNTHATRRLNAGTSSLKSRA